MTYYAVTNSNDHPLTMLDVDGNSHIFTPGLSVYEGENCSSLDDFLELVDNLTFMPLTNLKTLSVAAFKRLVSGPMTIACLKLLLSSDFLKPGQMAALKEVAENAAVKV